MMGEEVFLFFSFFLFSFRDGISSLNLYFLSILFSNKLCDEFALVG